MDENITDAIEFASTDNIADMQTSIVSALQSKIVDALEAKRIEVAQSFMNTNESLEEATFKFTGYASNSPHDDRSNRHDFEVKAKTTKHANDKAIKMMHTKFPDHTYHGVKIASEKSANESLDEYEIVKVYNPKTGRHEYVDDEGNVEHGSNGAAWQKSWYSRKRPSSHSSNAPSNTTQKIYHNVPFKQKDQAKAEGMRFDGEKKKWYHTSDQNSKKSAFPKLQESHLEEKLSVSDGVSAWIKDFVHSDDSRFEGKSKEERRQMALGAFYDAKKQQNEEVEQIDELSRSGIISRYINKTNPDYSSPKEIEKRKEGRSLALKKKWGDKKFGFPEPKVKAKD